MNQRLTPERLEELVYVQLERDFYVYSPPQPGKMCDSIGNIFSECTINVSSLPFAGLGYSINERAENGFMRRVMCAFKLARLQRIKQLGSLQDPFHGWEDRKTAAQHAFTHTRFLHSLDVHAIATLIARNNWRSLTQDQVLVLRIAALTHDTLTPAGGDTIKRVDPGGLDEDKHYQEVLGWNAVQDLCHAHRIDVDLLVQTVQGKGLLGALLDFADKIAYTLRDAWCLLESLHTLWPNEVTFKPSSYLNVLHWTRQHPGLGRVWSTVKVVGDQAVANPDRLAEFLTLRALMFRGVYCNDNARSADELIMEVLANHLYGNAFTRDELVEMDDEDLVRRIEQELGFYNLAGAKEFDEAQLRIEKHCKTLDEARARETELLRCGNVFVRAEDANPFAKPATHLLTEERGVVRPLSEARPEEAAFIGELCEIPNSIRVTYLTGVGIHKKFKTNVKAKRLAQLRRAA